MSELNGMLGSAMERNRERLAASLFEPDDSLRRLVSPTDEELAESRAAKERWDNRTRLEMVRGWWRWRRDVGLMPERLRVADVLRRFVYWLEG